MGVNCNLTDVLRHTEVVIVVYTCCTSTHLVSLVKLAETLNMGQGSISHVLIIGFLYVPAVSNDQDF